VEKAGGSEVVPPKELHEARQIRDAESAIQASQVNLKTITNRRRESTGSEERART
jgi:hypothetical protein